MEMRWTTWPPPGGCLAMNVDVEFYRQPGGWYFAIYPADGSARLLVNGFRRTRFFARMALWRAYRKLRQP
jgi:hypothetical protein